MKEEWLLHGAVVPVDVETTSALVAEIHRLIGVVGGMALAQPEQEPVAHVVIVGDMVSVSTGSNGLKDLYKLGNGTPLYTTPQPAQRKPLTDEEIYSVLENLQVMYNRPPTTDSRIIFVRAIEAVRGIKET